jgi:hypothetical protein
MENLTLEETPLQGGSVGGSPMPLGPGIPPPQNQQLPPQMFTTAAQLLDLTDSKDSCPSVHMSYNGLYGMARPVNSMTRP